MNSNFNGLMSKFFLFVFVLVACVSSAHAGNLFYDAYMEKIFKINEAYNWLVAKQMPLKRVLRKARENGQALESSPELMAASQEVDRLADEFDQIHMDPLVEQYAWAIPDDQAIQEIKLFTQSIGKGVIEVGAGKGYWAKLLSEQGVDIVAYDKELDKNPWFPVQRGTESSVTFYSDRALFLCWPPQMEKDGVAFKTLKNYQGQYLIYVGERPADPRKTVATGDPDFFQLLEEQFVLKKVIRIPNWPGYFDRLYFFEKKNPQPQLVDPIEDRCYGPSRGFKREDFVSEAPPLRRYRSFESVFRST